MDRAALESLDRDALVAEAEALRIGKAKILTRPELIDEILIAQAGGDRERIRSARGWLGRARDLVARVIERGLHLPDASDRFGAADAPVVPKRASVVPTVTLAEIYATQGHRQKALDTLAQVLAMEPEHGEARALRDRLMAGAADLPSDPVMPPEPENEDESTSSWMEPAPDVSKEPPEPASMLDAGPLPPRYGVDECVTLSVDPETAYVYWEVTPETLASLNRQGEGKLALRVLVIVPTWDGPRTATRDIAVHAEFGDWFVRELPKDAIVRAAIGWLLPGDVFVSAAHSFPAEPAPRERAPVLADVLARWTAEGTFPAAPHEADAVAVARAVARSEARRIAEERTRRGDDAWVPGRASAFAGGPLGSSFGGASDRISS
jgi:hypothetical protein